MATTEKALILKIEDMLYGMAEIENPAEDTGTLADTSDDTMVVAHPGLWPKDVYGEFVPADGTVGEVVRVASEADPIVSPVTVRRAQRGTTATAYASGETIRVEPKYTRRMIKNFLEDSIVTHLTNANGIWLYEDLTVTPAEGDHTYDIPANVVDVVWVYQVVDDEPKRIRAGNWSIVKRADSGLTATGKALRLHRVYDISASVRYVARTEVSTDYTKWDDEIAALAPWFVVGDLLGGVRTSPNRYDPQRQELGEAQESGPARDWRFFLNRATLMANEVHRKRLAFEEGVRERQFVNPAGPKPWLVRT